MARREKITKKDIRRKQQIKDKQDKENAPPEDTGDEDERTKKITEKGESLIAAIDAVIAAIP